MCDGFKSSRSTGQRAGTPKLCCRHAYAPSPEMLHSEHAWPADQPFSAGISEAAGSSAADDHIGKL